MALLSRSIYKIMKYLKGPNSSSLDYRCHPEASIENLESQPSLSSDGLVINFL